MPLRDWILSTLSILCLMTGVTASAHAAHQKLLFVDSYHKGYPWSSGIIRGVHKSLSALTDEAEVELKIIHMDTKRHTAEDFKKDAGRKVKRVIDTWQPDVVIAADDNASKYLVVPYFKNSRLPFVFCGVNWNAEVYGYPYSNVTGMVEVSLIPQLIEVMQAHARGPSIGLIGADNLSNKKEAINYKKKFGLQLKREVFVKSFTEMKPAFVKLQNEVDMIIISPPSFLQTDAEKAAAENFFKQQTKVPTGCVEDWITRYAVVGITKDPEEQGRWAANRALEILSGRSPSDIPVVTNKKAKIILNMQLAKQLQIKFPIDLIEQATFVEEMLDQ